MKAKNIVIAMNKLNDWYNIKMNPINLLINNAFW